MKTHPFFNAADGIDETFLEEYDREAAKHRAQSRATLLTACAACLAVALVAGIALSHAGLFSPQPAVTIATGTTTATTTTTVNNPAAKGEPTATNASTTTSATAASRATTSAAPTTAVPTETTAPPPATTTATSSRATTAKPTTTKTAAPTTQRPTTTAASKVTTSASPTTTAPTYSHPEYRYEVESGAYARYVPVEVTKSPRIGHKLREVNVTAGWYDNGTWQTREQDRAVLYEIVGVSKDVAVALRPLDKPVTDGAADYYVLGNPSALETGLPDEAEIPGDSSAEATP